MKHEKVKQQFANNLIAQMKLNNMNNNDLAREYGATRQAISLWVNAKNFPTDIAKLAEILHCEPKDFFN